MIEEEKDRERAEILRILQWEQEGLNKAPAGNYSDREIEAGVRCHLQDCYDENVIVMHCHHSSWPATGRERPLPTHLKDIGSLYDWGLTWNTGTKRYLLQFATIVWVEVQEDAKSGDRLATAGMVMEGLAHISGAMETGEEPLDPHYSFLGVWVMRKSNEPGSNWKIQFVINGLPAAQPDLGERQYEPRVTPETTIGPKGTTVDQVLTMYREHFGQDSEEEWDARLYDAIPAGCEQCEITEDWSERPFQEQRLWDLLGWDIAINRRGC